MICHDVYLRFRLFNLYWRESFCDDVSEYLLVIESFSSLAVTRRLGEEPGSVASAASS